MASGRQVDSECLKSCTENSRNPLTSVVREGSGNGLGMRDSMAGLTAGKSSRLISMTAPNALLLVDWLRWARAQLAHSASPQLDAELLLAHTLARPRSWLLANATAVLAADEVARAAALVACRARGEPIAYIVGFREFWSLRLAVTPDVLIPRPETELVVERALALRDQRAARVADLGTGSGAIALACASECPLWRLV